MIARVIDMSVRHKFAVMFVVAVGCVAGYWSMATMPKDALPELGETQVIIYSHWDRSPNVMEDQVTYPIVSAMLGGPRVKAVRGFSEFGVSYVYVIFDENTDLYWARSRTMEFLSATLARLPEGVKTEIGPDATSLGWVFQYALIDTSHTHNLADLRSYEDWHLRFFLKGVQGVAEVAPLGGFERQYQVNLDPNKLEGFGIPISQVVQAVREGNSESSGRVMQFGETEYMVRGRGYATTLDDFREIVVATPKDGSSVRIKDLGTVSFGPDMRRGVADLDGTGEVVSGIVLLRSGENALSVIDRVKTKLREIEPALPPGVKVVPIYDRSELIHQTVSTARETIFEVVITVALIILVFLWHFPSAAIPLVTMPAAVLISFIPLRIMGVSANVMSLAGVAIAFGELIDASIVVVEQTHKRLEQWERAGRPGSQKNLIMTAVKEVAGPTFFSLLVIAVAYLPVLTLEGQEGQLFRPLALSKSMAMIVAAVLAVTLDPALRLLLTNTRRFDFSPAWLCRWSNSLLIGKISPEEHNPLSRFLIDVYEPTARWTLRHKPVVLVTAGVLIVATIPVFFALGSEFMPPMDEGTILYMPTTTPGISIAEAQRVLEVTDSIIKEFPEVDRVLGKAGRADTATDPAPLPMFETLIILKPRSAWRHVDTWYSAWLPGWIKPAFRRFTPDTLSTDELIAQMNAAVQVPGFSNAWTMPIRGRIDMQTTGLRSPVGLKISGDDVKTIDAIGTQVEATLKLVRGTRSVFAERSNGGSYIDVTWNRQSLAQYGISMSQAQQVLSTAIGGETISTVVKGQERYSANVRYMRDFRSDLDALGRVLITSGQHAVPIREVATIEVQNGPAMIRNENGLLTNYVTVDVADRDAGSYIREADQVLRRQIHLPAGYLVHWSGQHEAVDRVNARLRIIVPTTLALIVVLIFWNTRSWAKTLIVMLAVPFSAIGAVWFLFLLHYNMSVAVWVGLIGLLSVDAETGVFMLLYLDLACEDARIRGRLNGEDDLREAVVYGAARRLRPKFMTFATTCIGLFPVMWSVGAGSDVMKRIAAPMVGGILTSFLLELLVYPAIYELWKSHSNRAVTSWGHSLDTSNSQAESSII
jgi:Cu(I)/Ag(I) efflux system membrane protein CusA/SilA